MLCVFYHNKKKTGKSTTPEKSPGQAAPACSNNSTGLLAGDSLGEGPSGGTQGRTSKLAAGGCPPAPAEPIGACILDVNGEQGIPMATTESECGILIIYSGSVNYKQRYTCHILSDINFK